MGKDNLLHRHPLAVVPLTAVDQLVVRVDAGLVRLLVEHQLDGVVGAGDVVLLQVQHLLVGLLTAGRAREHADVDDLVHRLLGLLALARGDQLGRSEEHTSELQSLMRISYAVFCLKNTTNTHKKTYNKLTKKN